MGSVLPLVGIAALMVLGFVILMTALTYEPPVKSEDDRALIRERRRLQRKQLRRQAQQASSAGLRGVRALAVTLRTWGIALAYEWWPRLRHDAIALAYERGPRLRHHARQSRAQVLSLESTAGQVIAAASVSVIAAYLIVAFG